MKKSALFVVLCAIVLSLAICWPKPVFAQRGGHAGGGGFHGAGGFHSGGGFHGNGGHYAYGGSRFYGSNHGGGYYGWHGSHWGYPYYGYGWGFSIGFGWPYSLGYAYPYGYGLWWGAPYYYPYYAPAPYRNNGSKDPRPPSSGPESNFDSRHNSGVPEGSSASGNSRTTTRVASTAKASNSRVVHSSTEELQPQRREVQNAIRALREMPPFVRQREIDRGRYSNFTPEEKELLRRL